MDEYGSGMKLCFGHQPGRLAGDEQRCGGGTMLSWCGRNAGGEKGTLRDPAFLE